MGEDAIHICFFTLVSHLTFKIDKCTEADGSLINNNDIMFPLKPHHSLVEAGQASSNVSSKFINMHRGGAVVSHFHPDCYHNSPSHTVVVSRVSLNAGCVDPS